MPRSAVIYTSPGAFAALKDAAWQKLGDRPIKPYTFSFGQRTDAGSVRVRITELEDGVLAEELGRMAERKEATFASSADRDVRSMTYDALLENADRSRWETTLQLVSPVIVDVDGQPVPFPAFPTIFRQYIAVWNTFSSLKIDVDPEAFLRVHVADFKISCVATPLGPGSQGWVTLEMKKGRTEREIALFNCLVDFAFYCGTGLHTDEGLGQTRRMERTGR